MAQKIPTGTFTVGRGGRLKPMPKGKSGGGGGGSGDNSPLWFLVPLVMIGMALGGAAHHHSTTIPSPSNPGPVTSSEVQHVKHGHHKHVHCELCLFGQNK